MAEPSSFPDAIRVIASGLRDSAPTHTVLNRAASGIDHLGRRLHGLGYADAREIADCFTAALAELDASHGVEDPLRREAVQRAVARLDAAAGHAAAGAPPSTS